MHDYNCCLVDTDKQQLAMCEAERISRRKHHVIKANDDLLEPIRKCCEELGVRPKQIDTIVFGHTDSFACKDGIKKLFRKANFVEVDHHLCHTAAAFFSSPYETSSIVSVDGYGDGSSGLLALGQGTHIQELERITDQHSIGLEYLRATIHLGLGGYGSEGKTQGLAPYGEPTLFEDYMNEIEITNQGNLKLSSRLQSEGSRLAEEGGYLNSLLLHNAFLNSYCPRRISPEPLTPTHMNLAASIQRVLETVVSKLCLIAKERTQSNNLVLSGGVVMNSSLNGKLLASGAYNQIFTLPMASDRGIGLGAALYHIHHNLGIPRFFKLNHVFYGASFKDRRAVRAMKRGGLAFSESQNASETVAQYLAEGKVVGWFQGRSEMGARALGHRSILADPRIKEMKDMINSKVKHREWFRPFAPSVLAEDASDYFQFKSGIADLSHMTYTVEATQRGKDIPAVIHVDNTARVQVVDVTTNPDYSQIISAFKQITGVPVLLNTSFNDNGEPIVETPEDAVNTFLKTDMDVLCIGNVIGLKK